MPSFVMRELFLNKMLQKL